MKPDTMPHPETLGVILAGGLAKRMGGSDKPLLKLGGQTLLAHVERRLFQQCESIILNANGDPSRFGEIGLPVVQDTITGHQGPLAGILAALEWAAIHHPSIKWVVSVPGDTPFIPVDLVQRLHNARASSQRPLACAASGSHEHYTTGLWPVDLRHDLRHALTAGRMRRVGEWAKTHGVAVQSWPTEPFDPFFNINTPEDLDVARTLFVEQPAHLDRSLSDKPAQGRDTMIEIDLSGLKCPLPVLRTRKALLAMKPGEQLRVICTDPLAGIDVPNLIRELGDILLEQRQDEKSLSFLIVRAEGQK